MMRKFLAILHARNLEFVRDRGALGWGIAFPVLVVFGFSFAYSGQPQEIFKVGLVQTAPQPPPGGETEFLKTKHVQFVHDADLDASLGKLRRHQLDMVVALESEARNRYWINSTSPKGYLLERILWGSAPENAKFRKETVEGREIRYVDWLISGLLGMNMMFSALFGVGYTIVRYRKNGVLKRLKATPLRSIEFLSAQLTSRLLITMTFTLLVYVGCDAFIHFQMFGSYLDLFLVTALGSISLIALSLLIAARTSSEEFAMGMLNLLSWPMIFLSGVWFSLEGMHPWVKAAARIFPLTHMIDAARAIMTEGATLTQVAPNLLVLALMSVVFLAIGAAIFKWE